MPQKPGTDPKLQALREQGGLNPRPQDVTDELFRSREFFDAHDQLQVKYEMLRRVENDGHSVTQAASAFGFSRPRFIRRKPLFGKLAFRDWFPANGGRAKPTNSPRKSSIFSASSDSAIHPYEDRRWHAWYNNASSWRFTHAASNAV